MTGSGDEGWRPEPSPDSHQCGGLRMERAHGCFRDLAWRVSGLEHERFSAERLARTLIQAGLTDRSRSPLVREFMSDDGDVMIFIPKTGRLELRIWGARPYPERFPAATSLLELLTEVLAAAGGEPAEP